MYEMLRISTGKTVKRDTVWPSSDYPNPPPGLNSDLKWYIIVCTQEAYDIVTETLVFARNVIEGTATIEHKYTKVPL